MEAADRRTTGPTLSLGLIAVTHTHTRARTHAHTHPHTQFKSLLDSCPITHPRLWWLIERIHISQMVNHMFLIVTEHRVVRTCCFLQKSTSSWKKTNKLTNKKSYCNVASRGTKVEFRDDQIMQPPNLGPINDIICGFTLTQQSTTLTQHGPDPAPPLGDPPTASLQDMTIIPCTPVVGWERGDWQADPTNNRTPVSTGSPR